MADAILVLNAGSSSLKFSLYTLTAGGPKLEQHGQLQGLTTSTQFKANAPDGALVAEQSFTRALGHGEALTFLLGHLRSTLATLKLRAVGHRVVHGGLRFARPVRVDAAVVAEL